VFSLKAAFFLVARQFPLSRRNARLFPHSLPFLFPQIISLSIQSPRIFSLPYTAFPSPFHHRTWKPHLLSLISESFSTPYHQDSLKTFSEFSGFFDSRETSSRLSLILFLSALHLWYAVSDSFSSSLFSPHSEVGLAASSPHVGLRSRPHFQQNLLRFRVKISPLWCRQATSSFFLR